LFSSGLTYGAAPRQCSSTSGPGPRDISDLSAATVQRFTAHKAGHQMGAQSARLRNPPSRCAECAGRGRRWRRSSSAAASCMRRARALSLKYSVWNASRQTTRPQLAFLESNPSLREQKMRLLILLLGWMAQEHARRCSAPSMASSCSQPFVDVDEKKARQVNSRRLQDFPKRLRHWRRRSTGGNFDAVAHVTPDRTSYEHQDAGRRRQSRCCARKPLAENCGKAHEMPTPLTPPARNLCQTSPTATWRRRCKRRARGWQEARIRLVRHVEGFSAEVAGVENSGGLAHRPEMAGWRL